MGPGIPLGGVLLAAVRASLGRKMWAPRAHALDVIFRICRPKDKRSPSTREISFAGGNYGGNFKQLSSGFWKFRCAAQLWLNPFRSVLASIRSSITKFAASSASFVDVLTSGQRGDRRATTLCCIARSTRPFPPALQIPTFRRPAGRRARATAS